MIIRNNRIDRTDRPSIIIGKISLINRQFCGQHVNEAMPREDPGNEVEFHFKPILRAASFMAVQFSYICNISDHIKHLKNGLYTHLTATCNYLGFGMIFNINKVSFP